MTHPRWERLLLSPVAAYFGRKGFRWQQPEMRFYDRRIDLYAFSRTDDIAVAVELKLHRWRYAMKQALLYQLCSDFVYIALPSVWIKSVRVDLLSEYGIGLVSVDAKMHCRQVVPAKASSVVRPRYRREYIRLVQGGR